MKKRINLQILKRSQIKVQANPNTLQLQLYKTSYRQIRDLLHDIIRPFHNICIHGYYPQIFLKELLIHRNKIMQQQQNVVSVNCDNKDNLKSNKEGEVANKRNDPNGQQQLQQTIIIPQIKIVDYLDILSEPYQMLRCSNDFALGKGDLQNIEDKNENEPSVITSYNISQSSSSSSTKESTQSQFSQKDVKIQIVRFQDSDKWFAQQDQFDLIISCLQLNHTNSEQTMIGKYQRSLKPDGALIGCAMVQGTLTELHWCYLMAENQRYGGLSPKILKFLPLGYLGTLLTSNHFNLATVLNGELFLEFDSPLDVLKSLQIIGESNHLKGRRKAVYKDLLISMYALYQSQYSFIHDFVQGQEVLANQVKDQKVLASLVFGSFIGWKYSENQPKPLRPGQHSNNSIGFVQELKTFDPDLEQFTFKEVNNTIQEVKVQNIKGDKTSNKKIDKK